MHPLVRRQRYLPAILYQCGPARVLSGHVLRLHGGHRPVRSDVDFGLLARRTPGFSGDDLASVVNDTAPPPDAVCELRALVNAAERCCPLSGSASGPVLTSDLPSVPSNVHSPTAEFDGNACSRLRW